MPVTLPDLVLDTTKVEIRGVAVPVRGFTLLELGHLIATMPAFAGLLNGTAAPGALLADPELLKHALATCADLDEASRATLTSAEQAALLKEVVRLTIKDAVGPFVDLAASLGEGAVDVQALVAEKVASMRSSSKPSAASKETATAPRK